MSEEVGRPSKKKARFVIDRREFVKTVVSLGILGTIVSFASLVVSLLTTAARSQQGPVDNIFRYGPEEGTWYSDKAGAEVMLADFDTVGKGAGVIWRGSIPVILIRMDESRVRGVTPTSGLVAFAALCTHLCCISTWRLDRPNEDVIFCRCHDGVFDPYNVVRDVASEGAEYLGAKVIGGPPPRAAPTIPLEIKDGKVLGVPQNLELYEYCG
jgi:Rieske Fe-S protein